MKRLVLKQTGNKFLLTFFEGKYLVWAQEFDDPNKALDYWLTHLDAEPDKVEIMGDIDL